MSYYLMTNPGYMLGTILVGIAMVFSLYCQAKIKSTYAKYRRRPNVSAKLYSVTKKDN